MGHYIESVQGIQNSNSLHLRLLETMTEVYHSRRNRWNIRRPTVGG